MPGTPKRQKANPQDWPFAGTSGGDGQNLTITTKKIESIDLPGLFVAASVSRLINVSHLCATP